MELWPIYAFACGAGLFFAYQVIQRRREIPMKALAARCRLDWLGKGIPAIGLSGTSLKPVIGAWNGMGTCSAGFQVVVFDCQIGEGKGHFRRTVIAAQTEASVFGAARFDLDLSVESSGTWVFLFRTIRPAFIPLGLMPVAELGACRS